MPTGDVVCPYVGLKSDPALRYSYASESHRCFALPSDGEHSPSAEHQSHYCLTAEHVNCPRFQARLQGSPVALHNENESATPQRAVPWLRWVLWAAVGVVALLAGWQLIRLLAAPGASTPTPATVAETAPAPSTTSAIPTPPPPLLADAPGSVPVAQAPGAVPTIAGDEVRVEITPSPAGVGWFGSLDSRDSYFGDSFLHAGKYQEALIHSAILFDLSRLPRGAPIRYVALEITGLDDSRLEPGANGIWEVKLMAPQVGESWSQLTYQELHNAPVVQSLVPPVAQTEVKPLVSNRFVLSEEQLKVLEQAVVDQKTQLVFRLDGPETGPDNLFTWDSGQGPETLGNSPRLIVINGPPPATPPPIPTRDFIVVTSTPTPENVLTAAAIALSATAFAMEVGTPAPTPRAMVTATPTPVNQETADAERQSLGLPPVVIPTLVPANDATATAIAVYATAQALTTGTWTPIPDYAVTATPTPILAVVTNTPTAENVATQLAYAIAEATRTVEAGPPVVSLPGVTTATPTPLSLGPAANEQTAVAQAAYATISALTTGTPPANQVAVEVPTATPLPTIPAESDVPDRLRNKIVFLSDRLGAPQLFVADAACVNSTEGCTQAEPLLAEDLPAYQAAVARQALSPDGTERLLEELDLARRPQVIVQNEIDGSRRRLVSVRGATFDAVWSPGGETVALVSNSSGNDEVYLVARDGSDLRQLTRNTWEWDRSPAWSSDGSQILFYSNRGEGRRQLWVMNANGTSLRNVSSNQHNDWEPVWIK